MIDNMSVETSALLLNNEEPDADLTPQGHCQAWRSFRARAAAAGSVCEISRAADPLIVPFAAGGNADIVGRIVGDRISNALGQPVVIDNRGGAGGSIGAEAVARSAPDGYTLLVASNGPLTVNPFVQAKLGYDPLKDFAPVALTSYVPHVIILNSKVEAKTIADLIALSKKAQVSIATSGVGSATHMTLERFKAASGANIVHVPYRSGGALMPDLIGGSIQAAMTEFSTALAAAQRRPGPHHRDCRRQAARSSPRHCDVHRKRRSRISSRKAISGSVAPPARRRRSSPNCSKRSLLGSRAATRPTNCAGMGSEIAYGKANDA
jgi:hypothetical protein